MPSDQRHRPLRSRTSRYAVAGRPRVDRQGDLDRAVPQLEKPRCSGCSRRKRKPLTENGGRQLLHGLTHCLSGQGALTSIGPGVKQEMMVVDVCFTSFMDVDIQRRFGQ